VAAELNTWHGHTVRTEWFGPRTYDDEREPPPAYGTGGVRLTITTPGGGSQSVQLTTVEAWGLGHLLQNEATPNAGEDGYRFIVDTVRREVEQVTLSAMAEEA